MSYSNFIEWQQMIAPPASASQPVSVHIQSSEESEATGLVAPAGQELHAYVPYTDLYFPASHSVHTLAVSTIVPVYPALQTQSVTSTAPSKFVVAP